MKHLEGKKVLIVAEELYEDLELWYPYYRLKEEGAIVTIAAPKEVVIDGHIITSRTPPDLPAFCRAIIEHFHD